MRANNLGNYALFLLDVRKDFDKAEELYKRAIEADPIHAKTSGIMPECCLPSADKPMGFFC